MSVKDFALLLNEHGIIYACDYYSSNYHLLFFFAWSFNAFSVNFAVLVNEHGIITQAIIILAISIYHILAIIIFFALSAGEPGIVTHAIIFLAISIYHVLAISIFFQRSTTFF